jgi:hypothetical protein
MSRTQNGTQSIEQQEGGRLLDNMYHHQVRDRLYNFQPVRFQLAGFHHGTGYILLRHVFRVLWVGHAYGNLSNTIDQRTRLLGRTGGK